MSGTFFYLCVGTVTLALPAWYHQGEMNLPGGISVRPDVMMGKPCVAGTRIPVYLLLEKMAAGETQEQILSVYPQLKAESLRACLDYAARLAADEVVLTDA